MADYNDREMAWLKEHEVTADYNIWRRLADYNIWRRMADYNDREMAWIKEHEVTVGTIVRVVRRAVDYEDGWNNSWELGMDEFVGGVWVVASEDDALADYTEGAGIPLEKEDVVYSYRFPYFVLEVV